MKTTVTTREFDDEGRCVKETVCEYDYTAPAPLLPTVVPYPWTTYPTSVTWTTNDHAGTLINGCAANG
jgi:hypothetical protein